MFNFFIVGWYPPKSKRGRFSWEGMDRGQVTLAFVGCYGVWGNQVRFLKSGTLHSQIMFNFFKMVHPIVKSCSIFLKWYAP